MGQRARTSGLLSMMDSVELRGLASYLAGRRWLRDSEGHPEGASDDADADDTDEDEAEEGADEDEGDGDKSKKDDDTDEDDKPKYTAREYDKLKRRLTASDKRQGLLQKQLDDLKASKEGELDKATKAEIAELKPKVETLGRDNRNLRLQVAFLSTPVKGVVWEDPEAAMKLIDLSDVDVDPDTGAIDRRDLAAAMRRLAKEKPYLVKKASKDDDKDEEPGESGTPVNRRRGKKPPATRETLAKRFPVLNQR